MSNMIVSVIIVSVGLLLMLFLPVRILGVWRGEKSVPPFLLERERAILSDVRSM